jgi:dTDP-4-dehydrorhamnose 3,5-epimerase
MGMKVVDTKLEGVKLIVPAVYRDERGDFHEVFNDKDFKEKVGDYNFVQDNSSTSKKGVLRGLHFQRGEHAQAKLVWVSSGRALDVVVDMRPDSETFGEHLSIILDNSTNNYKLMIPRGFAHGFIALEDDTVFSYKCDNYYHPESEGGIIFNDGLLDIDWLLDDEEVLVSKKDKLLSTLKGITYF